METLSHCLASGLNPCEVATSMATSSDFFIGTIQGLPSLSETGQINYDREMEYPMRWDRNEFKPQFYD